MSHRTEEAMSRRVYLLGIVISAGIVLVLLLALFWRLTWEENPKLPMPFHPPEPEEVVPVITAQELLRAFAQDEVAAREKYHGKRLWVRGTVTKISGPEVTLEGPPGVVCVYVSNPEIARLTIGWEATFEGGLRGYTKSDLSLFRPCKRMP
jgi:hypothetical protein